ncbi:hypothetical protein [Methanobacterium sp. CWC-01]|uniref:hypothetical protein n=1 Tax=Methanobacterium aridiramus TaxID=2584467 RepID=UPI0025753FFB|nr:hypothetical protein [Methanobacterium sp. CWC-01]
MVETQQASAGGMIGLAIIIAILILVFPFLIYWLAWFAVFMLFFGGIAALFAK